MITAILTEPLRIAVLAVAQALGGSLGAAIIVVAAALRLALLPLTIKLARRARAQQAILTGLKPRLLWLQQQHQDEPDKLMERTFQLYREAGYRPFDAAAFAGNLAQVPVLAAMYSVLRTVLRSTVPFLWVSNLARPDALLALGGVAITGVAAWAGGHSLGQAPRAALTAAGISAAVSALIFWHASAGLVLSWSASSAVTLVQSLALRRDAGRGERTGRPRL